MKKLFAALCALLMVLSLTACGKKEEEPVTKICPFCQSEISIKATRCPHCTSVLEEKA